MPSFRHKRTGKIIQVGEKDAFRYSDLNRFEPLDEPRLAVAPRAEVPKGTVAEVLAWVGDDPARGMAALHAEKAGKNRKGIIEALS